MRARERVGGGRRRPRPSRRRPDSSSEARLSGVQKSPSLRAEFKSLRAGCDDCIRFQGAGRRHPPVIRPGALLGAPAFCSRRRDSDRAPEAPSPAAGQLRAGGAGRALRGGVSPRRSLRVGGAAGRHCSCRLGGNGPVVPGHSIALLRCERWGSNWRPTAVGLCWAMLPTTLRHLAGEWKLQLEVVVFRSLRARQLFTVTPRLRKSTVDRNSIAPIFFSVLSQVRTHHMTVWHGDHDRTDDALSLPSKLPTGKNLTSAKTDLILCQCGSMLLSRHLGLNLPLILKFEVRVAHTEAEQAPGRTRLNQPLLLRLPLAQIVKSCPSWQSVA